METVHRRHQCSSTSSMHPGGAGGSLIAFHSVLVTSVPFRHSQDWKTPRWGNLLIAPSPVEARHSGGCTCWDLEAPHPTPHGFHMPSSHTSSTYNLDPRSPWDTHSRCVPGWPWERSARWVAQEKGDPPGEARPQHPAMCRGLRQSTRRPTCHGG